MTDEQLQRLIESVHVLAPKPGDVLVFTMPDDPMTGWTVPLQCLAKKFNASIFCLLPGYSLESLDEAAMRKAGWVRAADAPTVVQKGG